jgi:hypothetical protein
VQGQKGALLLQAVTLTQRGMRSGLMTWRATNMSDNGTTSASLAREAVVWYCVADDDSMRRAHESEANLPIQISDHGNPWPLAAACSLGLWAFVAVGIWLVS